MRPHGNDEMKPWLKMMRWTILLSVIALVSGCAPAAGNFCEVALRPYQWRDDAEIKSTPIQPLRYIEDAASIWNSQGCDQ